VPPTDLVIEISGQLAHRVFLRPEDLATLPRRRVESALHCVAGWSATGLVWEGVPFSEVYRLLIEPALAPGARVGSLVFVGLDGYRSIVAVEDALGDGVLIADRLDGRPLTAQHGAPARLVSPVQYGFVSTKYLCRIELHPSEPVNLYHSRKSIQRALRTVRPHRRARVWREERHRYVPSWLIRRIYRRMVPLPAAPAKESESSVRVT
jgi:DMSO/TMAO reductase YedYZ molybdopterin-dependent catalytic subunit